MPFDPFWGSKHDVTADFPSATAAAAACFRARVPRVAVGKPRHSLKIQQLARRFRWQWCLLGERAVIA